MVNKLKRFKRYKKHQYLSLYLFFFLIGIVISAKYIYQKLVLNDSFIKYVIDDSFGNNSNIFNIDFLLNYALNVELEKDSIVNREDDEIEKLEINNDDIKDVLVYIYNTHQEEKYTSNYKEPYSLTSSVLIASKILREYLKEYGINAIVEEDSISDKLHSLNWKYGYSYKVSRIFMEDTYKKNPSLKFFIDLHRDSSVYDKTTTEIDGVKYARVLFVVGLDHDNYEPNLKLAQNLRKMIDQYNNTLCRGIMKKSGKGVNGIYNQDFNEKTMLIEVGGQYNSISEVNNTLKVLANILATYIKEDINEKET